MSHDALKEVPHGNIVTTWNPWEFHKTVSMVFLDAMVLFTITSVFICRCPYLIANVFIVEPTLVSGDEMMPIVVGVCKEHGK
jgi:hypothetical protein